MSFEFGPNSYGPAFAPLVDVDRLCELGPGTPNESARPMLEGLSVEGAFEMAQLVDHQMAKACISAVWLLHDFLDESHSISQQIETTTGSYWHGIMHRREPDYSNAKYWFRRVGSHPVDEPLCSEARRLADIASLGLEAEFLVTQAEWGAFAFIDLCESVERGRSQADALCREIAQREWELLFDHCYRAAMGKDEESCG